VDFLALRWDVTNDSVMGGVSTSTVKAVEEDNRKVVLFQGTLSHLQKAEIRN
jgi:hypothetical protein